MGLAKMLLDAAKTNSMKKRYAEQAVGQFRGWTNTADNTPKIQAIIEEAIEAAIKDALDRNISR